MGLGSGLNASYLGVGFILALVTPLAGCTEPDAPIVPWDRIAGSEALDPARNVVELNLGMRRGDTIDYEWSVQPTGREIAFNIHWHSGSNVVEERRLHASAQRGQYTHVADGPVSLMWENAPTGRGHLTYWVEGQFTASK